MGDITLRKALDDYKIVYMASRNFAERTREEYLNDLEDLIQFLEQMGIREAKVISLPKLERYLAELDNRGIAGSTRKRKVAAIRSFLWYLFQDGYITTDIAKRLIPPFAEAKSPRYLTKPEYERLLEGSSQNPRDFALIQLLLQTGIKLSELIRLTVEDVELPPVSQSGARDIGYLHVSGGERQKTRILPLNHKSIGALREYLKYRSVTTTPALFINRLGLPLGARGVQKIVQKYRIKAGIKNANVHTLRNTFGVHHTAKGTSLKTITNVMGYKDIRSPAKYVSLAQELMKRELQDHAL
jgi:integrase/recombinase XerD